MLLKLHFLLNLLIITVSVDNKIFSCDLEGDIKFVLIFVHVFHINLNEITPIFLLFL